MTWAKIETGYLTNQKLMQLAPPAKLLHLAGILWSHDHATDGWIPEHMLPLLCAHAAASAHDAQALSSYGLWDSGPGGYWVHDFLKHQDSAATRENEREQARDRQRNLRASRRDIKRDSQVDSRRESRNRVEREEREIENTPLPPTNGTVVHLTKPDLARLTPSECERTFDQFWQAYPRRVGKRAARGAWDRATRFATPEAILASLRAALPELRKKDPQYIPHPTTWLNQGRWEDEGPAAPTKPAAPRGETRLCGGCDHDVVLAAGRCPTYGAVADIPTIAEIAGKPEIEICRGWEWINGRRPQGTVDRVARVDNGRDRGADQERQEGPGRGRALVGEPGEVRGHERRAGLLPHRPAG